MKRQRNARFSSRLRSYESKVVGDFLSYAEQS
jgi:hypothetical protein